MIRASRFDPLTRSRQHLLSVVTLLCLLLLSGCSFQHLAVNRLGNALAAQGSVFASDDDPDLVAQAAPFSLKLIESLLAESPRHPGLLLAASRGFAQYAYAFVGEEADELRASDPERSAYERDRARRLYLRARNYGLRGLDVAHSGFEQRLRADTNAALQQLTAADVPLLYWTAASWGLAISLSKDQPEVVADFPLVDAMLGRALALDESFEKGALHSVMIAVEMGRLPPAADRAARARQHFDRAIEISGGKLAGPFVSYAESVCVETQNRKEFEEMLGRAIAIDTDALPEARLENRVAQRRAKWLLSQVDELFLDSGGQS